MASGPYDIRGPIPIQRSRSNYYKPPASTGVPLAQSYDQKLYVDNTTNFMPAVPNVPPPSFQDATMVSIPADMFDRMFLKAQSQEPPAAKSAQQKFANPTPLSVVGFLLCLSPLSCDLMGWRGAGGNGAASVGAYFFIGGVLMLLGGFLEWVAGNTFPFVVFASFGGFWFSYGATLLPFFNAFGAYSPDPTDITAGLATKGFNASFGFFMIFMAVLCLIYLVCALRTNLVFVIIFAGLFTGFILLTATFWLLADGGLGADKTLYVGGASFAVSCMAGWYLLLALLLASVDFPIALPLVDLSGWIQGAT
ncbi:uncharacterized protein Z519_09029 [Cladophialophora bantiana CBS 173.52]|uniref:GPR1/FUN34/YaaH-class plasma membrane protein n=1 Tax=Cladophialophora bantiana (strain ATCC 10958 / CBS 173.52 / CDC B-1940 / NIH 8579) TaxID=1442370 RepID=A0A0D2I0K1_CLAB1|nr:uncharacterized protein Z519_09029 [Cladophialophora bantiana CBS 173.52]KIW90384.1 hypothetical protein Z519_09029 [Cladophialophora bantiana CBS 173.52]